jgi:hypothetical protein
LKGIGFPALYLGELGMLQKRGVVGFIGFEMGSFASLRRETHTSMSRVKVLQVAPGSQLRARPEA